MQNESSSFVKLNSSQRYKAAADVAKSDLRSYQERLIVYGQTLMPDGLKISDKVLCFLKELKSERKAVVRKILLWMSELPREWGPDSYGFLEDKRVQCGPQPGQSSTSSLDPSLQAVGPEIIGRHAGEILWFAADNSRHPVSTFDGRLLGNHFVIILPDGYRPANARDKPSERACLVITSHPPRNLDGTWRFIAPAPDNERGAERNEGSYSQFEDSGIPDDVKVWKPLPWIKVSKVGITKPTMIHESCLRRVRDIVRTFEHRAKLDDDSYSDVIKLLDRYR